MLSRPRYAAFRRRVSPIPSILFLMSYYRGRAAADMRAAIYARIRAHGTLRCSRRAARRDAPCRYTAQRTICQLADPATSRECCAIFTCRFTVHTMFMRGRYARGTPPMRSSRLSTSANNTARSPRRDGTMLESRAPQHHVYHPMSSPPSISASRGVRARSERYEMRHLFSSTVSAPAPQWQT